MPTWAHWTLIAIACAAILTAAFIAPCDGGQWQAFKMALGGRCS